MRSLTLVVPEAALLIGAVAALSTGMFLPRRRQWLTHGLAGVALLVAAVAALVAGLLTGSGTAQAAFHGTYHVDALLTTVRVVAPVAALGVLTMARREVRAHPRETEYAVLVLLATLGTVLLAGASDLLVLIAAYLLTGVPLYALAGFDKDHAGTESALKLALFGALAAAMMLLGVTAIFGLAGGTVYATLHEGLGDIPEGVVAGIAVFLLTGLLFEAGVVPAHFWVPDATAGAGVGVAALLTTVPKLGAVAAIHRLVANALPADVSVVVALLAAASMTLGNLAAFWQRGARRLLAYSTVSQVGYLLIAVAAAPLPEARDALAFYLAAYAVTNLGAFAVVAAVRGEWIDSYAGLVRRAPALAVSLVVCLLGLVGTPPTAVFVGKLTVFTAGVHAGLAWLVVLALANTVASLFYYLRWFAPAVFRRPAGEAGLSMNGWGAATAYAAAVLSLALGVGAGVVLG